MNDPQKIIIEMMIATKDAYTEMIKESKGYYHANRCKDSLELIRLLVVIYEMLEESK